jgi:hypothetical protein
MKTNAHAATGRGEGAKQKYRAFESASAWVLSREIAHRQQGVSCRSGISLALTNCAAYSKLARRAVRGSGLAARTAGWWRGALAITSLGSDYKSEQHAHAYPNRNTEPRICAIRKIPRLVVERRV